MKYSAFVTSLKNLNTISKILSLLITLCILFLSGCKKSHDPGPALTINSFSPTSGNAGTLVTIAGVNFSTTLANNSVTFNGTVAEVTQATATEIIAIVPDGATTGKIQIGVNGAVGTSSSDFTILQTPTITSFTPTFYDVSASLPTVTITGTGFSSTPADNVVAFNGTAATVSSATDTQLTMTLPSAATSGKITVTVNGLTGTSTSDFLIGCPDVTVTDVTVSNLSGNTFDVTYHIKNIGGVPLDINNMYFQAYISKTPTMSDSQYVGAGGDPRFSYFQTYELLQPNASLELHRNSTSGGSITTYPYVVVEIDRELNGPHECGTANNRLGTKIQP